MADITVITPKSSGSNPIVRQRLEQALERLDQDSVQAVAIVMINKDGSVTDGWANGGSVYQMIGALEALKSEYINACIERRGGDE